MLSSLRRHYYPSLHVNGVSRKWDTGEERDGMVKTTTPQLLAEKQIQILSPPQEVHLPPIDLLHRCLLLLRPPFPILLTRSRL